MVSATDVWTALAPYSIWIVFAIIVLVLYGVVRGWSQRAGTTSHKSGASVYGTLILLFLAGLWLYYTGWANYGEFLIILVVVLGVIYGITAGRAHRGGAPRRVKSGA
ncbi:MAG TPA: hypothetical protein VGV89_01585 [Thermoplasmata archaeon]|nr:hypothetical protein [Thermoplasmata archaeon]